MSYVRPNLKNYDSLKSLLESKETLFFFEPGIGIDELIKFSKVFLVSEPGYGKTRLLKERLLTSGQAGVFIDLKKIGKQDIETYIKNTSFPILEPTDYAQIKNLKLFKTKAFQLVDNENTVYCFDALDEVKQENFSEVVENIKNFIEKYSKSRFLMSCRRNYLSKWQHLFSEINFDYIEIAPLDTAKVREFLTAFKVSEGKIDSLLSKLHFQNRNLIIQTPRYLEMIAELVNEKGVDHLENITRGELFERFIYQKLNIESEKTNDINNQEITKKVLEKLALIMETYQTNQITKEELMEFFDDTKSNLNISFLNQVSINSFYERSLLKDNIDVIEFENTEFQEYLAAKEITRLGRLEQVVFDIAVVKEVGEIHPSWVNTLSFLIEFDILLLKTILEYVFSNKQKIHIEEHIKLVTRYGIEKLPDEDRRSIFKMVFSYFQKSGRWIGYDVAEKLSFYFDQSLYDFIEESFLQKKGKGDLKNIINTNLATIIAFLIERSVLTSDQGNVWKKRLKNFISGKKPHEVLLRRGLFALGKFKDISLFSPKLIKDVSQTGEDSIISNLVSALEDADPNHIKSINCFLAGVKTNTISARCGLYKVDKKEAIIQILNRFVKNENLLDQYVEHESIYRNDENEFVENIKRVADEKIVKIIKKIIKKAFSDRTWYRAENSDFIKEMVLLVVKYFPNFVFELIKDTSTSNTLFALKNVFTLILEKKDVERFINLIKSRDGNSTWIAVQTLQQIKYAKRSDSLGIYEEGRKFLENEYKQMEERQDNSENEQKEREKEIYSQFKHQLEPKAGEYNPGVFGYYVENKERLQPFIQDEDKQRLEKLIKDSIFEKIDPANMTLVIEKREVGGASSYTTQNSVPLFGDCILAAKELAFDVTKYRQKILSYIPFAYHDHKEAIFSLVPNPTEGELKEFLKLYEGRTDDLVLFLPSSTVEFCKKFNIQGAIPILKLLVDSDQIPVYERQSSLLTIANINEGEEYFQAIFDKYIIKEDDEKMISHTANKILIEKFKKTSAIEWRFTEIKNRAFPFQRPKGGHLVGTYESEINDREFALPLVGLKDLRFKDYFLDLLKNSFDVMERGEQYSSYASYQWSVVIDYFKNLKELRSFDPLSDIETFVSNNLKRKGINWFSSQFQQLKFEYITYIGKPQNISDCIKKYNFFKEKIYLDVATPRDLLALIKSIISKDLKKWVEEEGAYKYINKFRNIEDLIQKTIKTQFENGLLKAGLREEEINIQRESQLLDDKRTDFLISYGFIGPVLIEIKLSKNSEITNEKKRIAYRKKLMQYINGTDSHYGVFLVFQVERSYAIDQYLPLLKKLYEKEKNLIEIAGLNCVGNPTVI